MFNSVNNPFGQKIESAISTGQDRKQHQQEQRQEEEKRYLEDDDKDEVSLSPLPVLSEDDVKYLAENYIAKLKTEHQDNPKVVEKLDKFYAKFDVKKFMKRNPDMTSSDFYMVMYNEVCGIIS